MFCHLQMLITIASVLFFVALFGESSRTEKSEHFFGATFIYSQSFEEQNIFGRDDSYSRKGPAMKQIRPSFGFSYFYRTPESIFLGADVSLLDGKHPHYFFANKDDATQNIGELKRTGFEGNFKIGYSFDLKERKMLSPYALYGLMQTQDQLEKKGPRREITLTSTEYETKTSYFGAGMIFSHPISYYWRADIDSNIAVIKKIISTSSVKNVVQHGMRYHLSPSIAFHIPSSWVTLKSGFEYNLSRFNKTETLANAQYRDTKFFLTTYLCF